MPQNKIGIKQKQFCLINKHRIQILYICIFCVITALFGILTANIQQSWAEIGKSINYQGRLMNASGLNVSDGTYSMKISIYSQASGGSHLWSASTTNGLPTGTPANIQVEVKNGLFSILLGDTNNDQVAFPEGLFNNDTLYLGITVGADSEMTPRKRLSAVPYAYNSQTLQGQYASNTVASTGGDLFALHQSSNDSASAERTALAIYTSGTNNLYDLLIKANSGSDVFSVSRQGSVTTTGNLQVDGITQLGSTLSVAATSSLADLSLTGRVNSNLLPYITDTYSLGNSTYRWLGITAQNVNTVNVSSTNIDALGYVSTTNLYSNESILGNATTTNLYNSGTVSTTALYVNGVAITGAGATPSWQQVTDVGATTNDWIQFAGATSTDNIVPNVTNSLYLGTSNYQWLGIYAQNADFTSVSTTNLDATGYIVTNNLTATNADLTNVSSTNIDASGYITANTLNSNTADLGNVTTTNLYNSGTVSTTNLYVNGVEVTGIESQNLQDVTDLGVATTNWIQFAGATSTSNFLPGTNNLYTLGSSAYRWANLFAVNGNFTGTVTTTNLFASGYVSTTSLYVNGSQITGATPTLQDVTDEGYVTTNPIRFAGASSTGHFLPTANLTYDLGSASFRWRNLYASNGIFTSVSTTNLDATGYIVTNNLTATNADLTNVSSTNIDASGYITANTLNSNTADLGNVTTTNLYNSGTVSTTNLYVNGVEVTGIESQNLQDVTDLGVATTNWIQFAGATSTNHFLPGTNNLYTLGSSAYRWANLFAVNGNFTGTVTTTNLFASGYVSTTSLYVNGSQITGATPTLQDVTDEGYVTTNPIRFAGASSTGHFLPTANLTYDLGSASFRWRNLYASNGIFTSVSTTNLDATGYIVTNNLTATNADLTNVSSTNIDASGYITANTLNSNTADLGNVTTTNLYNSGTVSTTALYVNGVQITGGGSGAQDLQDVTDEGYVTTNPIRVAGATSTDQLFVLGSQDAPQLIVQANATQDMENPLILFRNSAGTAIGGIHTNDQSNIFAGFESGAFITTGTYNTALGFRTMYNSWSNITGSYNTAIGAEAMWGYSGGVMSGSDNTGVGYRALATLSSGYGNTAVGHGSLADNTTGYQNNAFGYAALANNTTGWKNVAIGVEALTNNINGESNTSVGNESMYNNNGDDNVAVGKWAMRLSTTADQTVGIGASALSGNNATGTTGVGYRALYSNSTGINLSGVGHLVMDENTTGSNNTAMGSSALYYNRTGSGNTSLGSYALHGFTNNSHSNNTGIGYNSLFAVRTGSANTALGGATLYSLTTGASNTAIGYAAGDNITTGSNNILIGNNIDSLTATGNYHLNIGNTLYGDLNNGRVGVGVPYPYVFKLTIDGHTGPSSTNAYDLGSATYRWRNLYASNGIFTSVSTTNIDALGYVSTTNLYVNGSLISGGTPTLQDVTDEGYVTTNPIRVAGASSTGHILPVTTLTYDLGSSANRWKDLWVSSTYIGGSTWNLRQNASGYFSIANVGGSERVTIDTSGNVGIGDTTPAAMLTVGNGDAFQVNSSGNLIRINGVTYNWPAANTAGAFRNDGSGNISFNNNVSQFSNDSGYLTAIAGQTLASTNLWVGNASNLATAVAMSGDATMSNTGAVTVANDSHTHNATTISGLSTADFTSANISQWTNDSGYITGVAGQSLTSANLWVGNASNLAAAVALSGDGSITNAGVLTVNNDSHSHTGTTLSIPGTSLTSANLWVGNVSNQAAAVTMSGDATMTNGGVVAVANDSHTHNATTISGLSTADFTSANISNWTNDAGYLTNSSAFIQNGNSFTAAAVLGTNDAYSVSFETGGVTRATIDTSGHLSPGANITYDLGLSGTAWRNMYSARTLLTAGTQAAPAYSFAGDLDTGFYNEYDGGFTFSSNNSRTLSIDMSSGNGQIYVYGGNAVGAALILNDADNNRGTKIAANPTIGTTYTLTLPNNAPGSSAFLKSDTSGNLSWDTNSYLTSLGNAFVQNGNSFTADAVLGTNDGYSLFFETAGVSRGVFDTAGTFYLPGSANSTRLAVRANAAQTIANPLIQLQTSAGAELARIHADNDTNLFAGYLSGSNNSASYNAFFGSQTGAGNTTGQRNTAMGWGAMYGNGSTYAGSSQNVAIGHYSQYNITGGALDNASVGAYSMVNLTSGDYNSGLGSYALNSISTGGSNVAVGYAALTTASVTSNNTALGANALYSNTGGNNVAVGYNASRLGGAVSAVVSVGYESLYNNTATGNMGIGVQASYRNTSGDGNTALGYQALYPNQTGAYNTAVGYQAIYASTGAANSASYNSALGYQAMFANTTGQYNTAMGSNALRSNTTGGANVALGTDSLYSLNNVVGNYNVALGPSAAYLQSSAANVIAIGASSLYNNNAGNTIGIGYEAAYRNTTGAGNLAIGYRALYPNQTGNYNTAIGELAMYASTGAANSSNNNTAVGYRSLYSNTTGGTNTAVGTEALFSNTTGSLNTAVGYNALNAAAGNGNTAIGARAMDVATGSYNTAIGNDSIGAVFAGTYSIGIGGGLLTSTAGDYNIALGVNSLYQINNTAADYNIGIGSAAGFGLTSGARNVILGANSAYSQTTASDVVSIGYNALNHNTASQIVAIGSNAGYWNTAGTQNTIMGYNAYAGGVVAGSDIGSYNTSIGWQSMYVVDNAAADFNTALGWTALTDLTSGNRNSAGGAVALGNVTTGSGNTAFGTDAGNVITTGSNNTFLGYNANATANNYTNSTAIGYNASVTASNQVRLGATDVNGVYAGGAAGNGGTGTNLYYYGTISDLSDVRAKKDIIDNNLGLNFVLKLQPRHFKMLAADTYDDGFIAQEVYQVASELSEMFNGVIVPEDPEDYYYIDYTTFVGPLVNAVQELYASSSPLYAGIAINPDYSTSAPFLMIDENGDLAYSGGSITAQGTASTSTTTYDSGLFSLQGSSWDNSTTTAITTSFSLINKTLSATSSRLEIGFATGTNGSLGMSQAMLTITNAGDVAVSGDLTVGRRLYLGSKTTGMGSTSTYLFVDDTLGASSTYIATNADGWQASTAYDYAERYESNEQLEPGDLVTADPNGINKVKRSTSSKDIILGIVSTKPGFMTGGPAPDTYPVALAGRVPTKVSTQNGHIRPGDFLAPSDMPGVAVKATEKGSIIGVALEAYDKPGQGLISVFVNVSYMGDKFAVGGTSSVVSEDIKGFAYMKANTQEVLVNHANLQGYPIVQLMPQGYVKGSYWVQDITGTSFKIMFSESQTADIKISYVITLPNVTEVPISDGTIGLFDTLTGQVTTQSGQPIAGPIAPEPDPEPPAEPEPEVEPAPEPESEPLVTVEPEPTG